MFDKFKRKGGAQTRMTTAEVSSRAGKRIINDSEDAEDAVKQRIIDRIGCSATEAESVYTDLVTLMQSADLTYNFLPETIFSSMPANQLQNVFERKNREANYMNSRERVEDGLFQYSYPESDFLNVQDVIDRMRKKGSYQGGNNASFDPRIRPKYGALNIFNLREGGAGNSTYGQSHLIFKDYVKHRCTFTSDDSFNIEGADPAGRLANIFYLDKIIMELSDPTFSVLCSSVTNIQLRPGDVSDLLYIEAQIHSEILFSRDVKKIRLSQWELALDSPEGKDIIENIALLACKYGIPVEVFN